MTKRVLVTGASGFVGRNVVSEFLERGYEVHAIIHSKFLPACDNLVQYHIDLMNSDSVINFLAKNCFKNLVHLAWYVGQGCQTSDVNLDWVCLSLNLLKQFQKYGGKKVLITGSVSEYDYNYGYLSEDLTPLNNEFLYGKSKAALYVLSKAFCELNNLDFKWARLFNIYGPNEKETRLMPSVILSMLKGEDVKVSNCKKFQDYLYVEDVAKAIVMLFESGVNGAVNICSGRPVQLQTIVEKIAQYMDFKGKILWGAIPSYFSQEIVVGNNLKLKNEVKFEPKYTLEEGLKSDINWWKGHSNV